jgi:hypothetical protein
MLLGKRRRRDGDYFLQSFSRIARAKLVKDTVDLQVLDSYFSSYHG